MQKKNRIRIMSAVLAAGMAFSPAMSLHADAKTTTKKTISAASATVTSEITGLPISSSIASQRPVAVMIDNDTRALPHYGLAEADVVYEMVNSTKNNRLTSPTPKDVGF